MAFRSSAIVAAWLLMPAAASDEFVLGVFGPMASITQTYVAMAIAFDIDFRKNFNATLAARFGAPVVTVPDLNPALKIKTQIGTSNSDVEVGVRTALDMFQGLNGQETIQGLVGGGHSAISMPVAQLATQFKVPMVSWASTSPKLSNKVAYPWFLRTVPPDMIQAKAMWGFMRYFRVPAVTVTYSQEAYGEGLFQALGDEASAANEGFRIAGVGVQYFPSDYDMNEARAKVLRIKALSSKIVLLAMTVDQARPFSQALEEAGLTSGRWQLLGADGAIPSHVPVLNTIGYTAFNPISRGALFADFKNLWTKLTPDDINGDAAQSYYNVDEFAVTLEDSEAVQGIPMVNDATFADSSVVDVFGPFIFDAAYAFVHAINSLLNNGTALADIKGKTLLDALKVVFFEGISGTVAFDQNGDRAASFTFDNVQPDTARRLSTTTVVRAAGSYSAATGVIAMDMDLYWMTGTVGNVVPDTLVSCEPGFWKDSEGDSPTLMCYECEPGTISAGGTVSRCDTCDAGKVANVGRGATRCIDCAAGNFSAESKSTHCSPCLPGHYQDSSAATGCDQCKAGTYASGVSQTTCISCSDGKKSPQLYSTQKQVEVFGKMKWVPFTGATSAGSCGCSEGAYQEQGECTVCGEGMICPGMGEVLLEPSYFASVDKPGFVFRCFGGDHMRCSGGPPGTCAAGRLNSTLACSSCVDMMRPGEGGACEDCGDADQLPFIVALILCIALAIALYWAVDTENPASRNTGLLLIAITGSQTITLFQQIGVFSSIALEWPPPFTDMLDFLAIFTFKLDYLYLECVAKVDPLAKFVGRVATVLGFLVLMNLIHVVAVLAFRKGAFRERMPSLLGAIGTMLSAFFISIVSSMLSPFQCNTSPNGVRTVSEYHSVVCYDSSYGSSHAAMMGVGLVACSVPLGFLAAVACIVKVLPSKLAAGNTRFLHAFAFLFFRFQPGAYWYALVFVVRNLLISLVPPIGSTEAQILILQCIISPLLILTVYIRPWAVWAANAMDVANTLFLSMMLLVFALFTSEVNAKALAMLCCSLLVLALLVLVASVVFGVYLKFARKGKPFQLFICHHKAGAGNLARLLKMHLVATPQVTKNVFVDSDNLRDLGSLFSTVASDTEKLVVLCSKEILSRPWCMGEVSTARVNHVNIVKVILPDFRWPDDEFIKNYEVHVPDASTLTKHGLSLDLVKESIRWLSNQGAITFSEKVHAAKINSLVTILLRSHTLTEDVVVESSTSHRPTTIGSKHTNCILADACNMEARCAALVLQRLLTPIMQGRPETIPIVIDDDDGKLTKGVQQLCLVCTNDVFRSPSILANLMQAAEDDMAVLPVVSEPSFRFPTQAFMQELERDSEERLKRVGLDYAGHVLVKVVERLFTEIAIEVNPQDAESVLTVRAQAVALRLNSGLRPLGLDLQALVSAAPQGSAMKREDSDETIAEPFFI